MVDHLVKRLKCISLLCMIIQSPITFTADQTAKVVVLLFNAGPMDVSYAKHNDKVDAMFACGFPAQSAGEAIYRVLSGQENPAGRLPNTWPASDTQV